MKFGVYSIRDIKSGFMTPTIDQSDVSAARNFDSAVMSASSGLFATHPDDFILYKIGEFDSETGIVSPLAMIQLIREGGEVGV